MSDYKPAPAGPAPYPPVAPPAGYPPQQQPAGYPAQQQPVVAQAVYPQQPMYQPVSSRAPHAMHPAMRSPTLRAYGRACLPHMSSAVNACP